MPTVSSFLRQWKQPPKAHEVPLGRNQVPDLLESLLDQRQLAVAYGYRSPYETVTSSYFTSLTNGNLIGLSFQDVSQFLHDDLQDSPNDFYLIKLSCLLCFTFPYNSYLFA